MARLGLPDALKGEGVLIVLANLFLISSIISGNGVLIIFSVVFFLVLVLISRKVVRG